jgi:hypothetical protein
MKKIAVAGLIAIGLIAIVQQQASAWVNHRFSIGLNWHRQAGGNNFLWGAYRNGQPPGPEAFGGPLSAAHMPHYGAAPMQMAPAQTYAPQTVAPPASQFAGQQSSPFTFASYPRETYYYYPAPAYYFYFYGE